MQPFDLGARRLVLAAAMAALAGCASPAPPKDHFYRLEPVASVAALPQSVLPGVLEVNRLDVDGVLSERAIAYQSQSGALGRHPYDLWSDAPATALQQSLADTLRSAHVADQVVTPDLRVPPDWSVRGRLSQFEQVPATGMVRIKLQLAVMSARDGTLVLQKTYADERPVAGAGTAAAVAAFNQGCASLLAQFASDLSQISLSSVRHP